MVEVRIVQRGFQRKQEILPLLNERYASALVEWIRNHNNSLVVGDTKILLAHEFGFCYGVDRAIQYAYETRAEFPDRRIYLTGEIIHNPYVNRQLKENGIEFIPHDGKGEKDYSILQPNDVVIIPAFGVTVEELGELRKRGCTLVDTTCGSVMNVWKSVRQYARDGFTSVIHGKYYHEETRATVSQALAYGGHYLIILNSQEAEEVARFVEGQRSSQEFMARFAPAVSLGFDPALHLQKVGLANQTTMLMNESLKIQDILRSAYVRRYGEEEAQQRFRVFETICSATQDRQDAVIELLEKEKVDLVLVIGGFNSSNTGSLLDICSRYAPSYHIENMEGIINSDRIFHKPYMKTPIESTHWLPKGKIQIGLTAGASTPNSVVAEVILRILEVRGEDFRNSECFKEIQ